MYSQLIQRSVAAESSVNFGTLDNGPAPLAGQNVVTSDGERVGEVILVKSNVEGRIQAVYFRTTGWLGFGKRTVAVATGEFSVTGQDVILNINSTEVSALPEAAPLRG